MPRRKWKEQAEYWKTVPASANFLVLAAIFCMFASFGLMSNVLDLNALDQNTTVASAVVSAAIMALFSVGIAFTAFRAMMKSMIAVILSLFVLIFSLNRFNTRQVHIISNSIGDPMELRHHVRVVSALAMMTIMLGYIFIVTFLRKEGLRVFGPLTEVKLAREVHHALVPAIARQIGQYEICGASVPSGQVGGDLVDVIVTDSMQNPHWTAYVADVSGHGVPAGMVMAMVKSAMRMGSSGNGVALADQVADLNRTLASLSGSNVFVTFACIAAGDEGVLQFTLAGHFPILHYRKRLGIAEERSVSNLPLAVFSDTKFEIATIVCEPGDILAVVTDGLTEVADKQEHELGFEALQAVFLESARRGTSLQELLNALLERASRHGKQTDDQTVLLVRRKEDLA
ncbi:MAG: serine/threonine-protein phosphatase [Acidobacteriia bacterium]|nr:serine/threonine-protein phosphatase [Terriglobia bacterium]